MTVFITQGPKYSMNTTKHINCMYCTCVIKTVILNSLAGHSLITNLIFWIGARKTLKSIVGVVWRNNRTTHVRIRQLKII